MGNQPIGHKSYFESRKVGENNVELANAGIDPANLVIDDGEALGKVL